MPRHNVRRTVAPSIIAKNRLAQSKKGDWIEVEGKIYERISSRNQPVKVKRVK